MGTSLGPPPSSSPPRSMWPSDSGIALQRASAFCRAQLMTFTQPRSARRLGHQQPSSTFHVVTTLLVPRGRHSEFTCKCSRGAGSRAMCTSLCQSAFQPGASATCCGGMGEEVHLIKRGSCGGLAQDRQSVVGIGESGAGAPTDPCRSLHEGSKFVGELSQQVGEWRPAVASYLRSKEGALLPTYLPIGSFDDMTRRDHMTALTIARMVYFSCSKIVVVGKNVQLSLSKCLLENLEVILVYPADVSRRVVVGFRSWLRFATFNRSWPRLPRAVHMSIVPNLQSIIPFPSRSSDHL
jgi:hypothetical protein